MITSCTDCKLFLNRKRIVNGYGSINSSIIFIGEAPGGQEDKYGIPFIGKAGKLLTKYLTLSGFDRERIYITNVVKCRPPGNRTPFAEEINHCKKHLFSEILEIKPKIIVLLGNTALQLFFNSYITKVHGKAIHTSKYIFIPIFHPSYVLKNKDLESLYLNDFRTIVGEYQRNVNIAHKHKL